MLAVGSIKCVPEFDSADKSIGPSLEFLDLVFESCPVRDFRVRLWDGTVWGCSRPCRFTLVLKHPGALRRMFLQSSELALGESYIFNDFDVEGNIEASFAVTDFLLAQKYSPNTKLHLAMLLRRLPDTGRPRALVRQIRLYGAVHSPDRDRRAISYHYDLPAEFYALFLDPRMIYSCAYFRSPEETLEAAQERKLDYLCRKLRLRRGERLLDIGCGWGGLITHASTHYGVRSLGITLSGEQADFARQRIHEAALDDLCQVELRDYRELKAQGQFDKIASVGMFEHVGEALLPKYFKKVYGLLRPQGAFLNHGIARSATYLRKGPSFINSYVFPDGELVPIHTTMRVAELNGFEVRDVENLREHYTLTLHHWIERVQKQSAEARRLTDDITYRIWRLYMAGSAHAFRTARLGLYQTLLVKPKNGETMLPLTREDWYRPAEHLDTGGNERKKGKPQTNLSYSDMSCIPQPLPRNLHTVHERLSVACDPERHSRIVSALRMSKLDAFFCSLPTQVLLLSGYWPVMGTSAAIITAEGEVHILVPSDEEDLAKESSLAERTVFQPARIDAITDAQTAIREPLIELWRRLSLERATVGVETGQFLQPSSYAVVSSYRSGLHEVLRSEFRDLRLVPADRHFQRLRATKTIWELRKIRTAACIARAGFEAGKNQVAAGMREPEIASLFQSALEQTPLAASMHRSYGFFSCMSGPNSAQAAAAYARTRQRTIDAGDLVMIHCNSCGDGFWTDITRTYAAGDLDAKQEDMHAAIMEARTAALASIAPGVNARDVDLAARAVLERHGFGRQFKHGTGHEVGFAAANHNAIPRIHPESLDVLASGMTFNVEPAIYIDGYGGMRRCDMVAVTDTGVQIFTDLENEEHGREDYERQSRSIDCSH